MTAGQPTVVVTERLYSRTMERTSQGYHDGRGELAIVVDCSDLERAARFWADVLGYIDTGEGGSTYRVLLPRGAVGVEVLLQRVPDRKQAKNRVHLDLRTRDLEAEVSRVRRIGATVLTASPITEDGWRWHVLADPDGNEFCVLQPRSDYWSR